MAICGLSDGLNLASKTLLSNSSHLTCMHCPLGSQHQCHRFASHMCLSCQYKS